MLSDEEKARRKRERMLEKARERSPQKYRNKYVAPVFQRMFRAEAALVTPGTTPAINKMGLLVQVQRRLGEVVCVTCAKVGWWSAGLGGMHTGHFLASRTNSIIFESANIECQCSNCNWARGGEQQIFRKWMLAVRGKEVVERLEALKNTTVSFSHEDLVDRKIEYGKRLKAAEATLEHCKWPQRS